MKALHPSTSRIVIIGSGIGGLTAAALLAQTGYDVTVLEAQSYPGGCASTYYHQGYRFDSGATVAGGFQPDGPHALVGEQLNIKWPVRPHDPAWVVHLPDRQIALTRDNADVLAKFPQTGRFWNTQSRMARLGWKMSAHGLPWPPTSPAEAVQLARTGMQSFPENVRLLPFAFRSVYRWAASHGLANDPAFVRFLDAQLLISAQTTSRYVNAIYGAAALDLARQGTCHVEGGIGGLAEALVGTIKSLGGRVLYRQRVTRIDVHHGCVTGVYTQQGRRGRNVEFIPCDFLIANLTPRSLDDLLGDSSPPPLRREVKQSMSGWGAFVLHLGIKADQLPPDLPDHHQIITEMTGPLGEGRSIFISLSPSWDTSRAPGGHRAVTVTTHTAVESWWTLLKSDPDAYEARKQEYTSRILSTINRVIPGFQSGLALVLPGTPVTYHFYTGRSLGMVGGFPQTSLFKARGPRTGIANLRLVGDSIFPGQSTAGVTLGAIRVAKDVQHSFPSRLSRYSHTPESQTVEA